MNLFKDSSKEIPGSRKNLLPEIVPKTFFTPHSNIFITSLISEPTTFKCRRYTAEFHKILLRILFCSGFTDNNCPLRVHKRRSAQKVQIRFNRSEIGGAIGWPRFGHPPLNALKF
jgi:hypothetical protein